jgi:hypothetical protein
MVTQLCDRCQHPVTTATATREARPLPWGCPMQWRAWHGRSVPRWPMLNAVADRGRPRRLVHRRGRFVEEEPVGLLGEGALDAQEPFHQGAPFPYLSHPGGVWGATGLQPSGHSATYG